MKSNGKLNEIFENMLKVNPVDQLGSSVTPEIVDYKKSMANESVVNKMKRAYYLARISIANSMAKSYEQKIDDVYENLGTQLLNENSDDLQGTYAEILKANTEEEANKLTLKKENMEQKANVYKEKLSALNNSQKVEEEELRPLNLDSINPIAKEEPKVEAEEETTAEISQSLEKYADDEIKNMEQESQQIETKEPEVETKEPEKNEPKNELQLVSSQIEELVTEQDQRNKELLEKFMKDHEQDMSENNKDSVRFLASDLFQLNETISSKKSEKYIKFAQASIEEVKRVKQERENSIVEELNSQKEALNSEKSKNTSLNANLQKAEELIHQLQQQIQEKDATINGLNEKVSEKEKENGALKVELETKEKTIYSLNSIVSGFQSLNLVEKSEYSEEQSKTK